MNWKRQFLTHNLAFLHCLISLGKLTSIPLLNMHLKSSVSAAAAILTTGSSKATCTSQKFCFLARARGFFSSSHLLSIYNSQIFPSLEYYSHVWSGAPKSTLCLLDKVQSKAIRLINNPNLTKSLQTISHRLLVGDLSIFYRYFNGHSSQEIRETAPVPLRRVRATRSSTHSHHFQVSLPNPRSLSHKSSFIPRTCNLWNVLPSSCFPESYNLPYFKPKINKLDLIPLSS